MDDIREYSVDQLTALLPLPAPDANKYARGTLTAVVGSARYPGAACLAAFASQRMGAGYTRVITDPSITSLVQSFQPSLVVQPWSKSALLALPASLPNKPHAYLVGCGFDAAENSSERQVHDLLKHAETPVLVDGGGLAALCSEKGKRLVKRRFMLGLDTVVTPHAGEAARLAQAFNLPTEDPAKLSRLLSLAFGVVAVVKGPITFVSDGESIVRMAHGTPALAKAGTGDVLAGMMGALLAQGLHAFDAAVLATDLHARAGRLAAEKLTDISVTAEDVIEHIPAAIMSLASER